MYIATININKNVRLCYGLLLILKILSLKGFLLSLFFCLFVFWRKFTQQCSLFGFCVSGFT